MTKFDNNEETKTVEGWNGDKEISRARFIEVWESQVSQLHSLADSQADLETIKEMKNWIALRAGSSWDGIK